MSDGGAPPGWYADPSGGGQRYYDGAAWTEHAVPWPPGPAAYGAPAAQWWGAPPWKGAAFGRPPYGPGALADPGRRLAARLLDSLVFLPVFVACIVIAIVIVAPHAGPMFPKANPDPNASLPTPGFVWLYLASFGAAFVGGLLFFVYEGVMTTRYGRTLGKRWMHIRPVTLDGRALAGGRSFGRAATVLGANLFGWLGLLDQLWCLWDANSQCVHDKIASTLVVTD